MLSKVGNFIPPKIQNKHHYRQIKKPENQKTIHSRLLNSNNRGTKDLFKLSTVCDNRGNITKVTEKSVQFRSRFLIIEDQIIKILLCNRKQYNKWLLTNWFITWPKWTISWFAFDWIIISSWLTFHQHGILCCKT